MARAATRYTTVNTASYASGSLVFHCARQRSLRVSPVRHMRYVLIVLAHLERSNSKIRCGWSLHSSLILLRAAVCVPGRILAPSCCSSILAASSSTGGTRLTVVSVSRVRDSSAEASDVMSSNVAARGGGDGGVRFSTSS